ncbi:MAG: dynamin family protein [Azospirillaceae bacterium]|nr:dynamin family protein [Azospirillaceae bacterium]
MESFERFEMGKADVLASMTRLRAVVAKLGDLGLDVAADIGKIEQAVRDVQDDVLRIALLGAFSDGKTSVVAGWLGQVMPDMKIDSDESSDRLAFYRPDNLPARCEIVDTPGLFGDKRRQDEDGVDIQYGDITREYLSEAHLIFYVVDATNPLKDSHKDVVRWVLRDLNKLAATIFVINKMDEVADLRDADDFAAQARIKKDNLAGKLQRFVALTDVERAALNIVCVASNPNGRGLDFWFEKKQVYEERSRIGVLRHVANTVLDHSTRDVLIRKTGLDVVGDVLGRKLAAADEEIGRASLAATALIQDSQRVSEEVKQAKRTVMSARGDLSEELQQEEKRLQEIIRALGREGIVAFLEDEIGYSEDDTGYKLRLKIDIALYWAFEQSTDVLGQIAKRIETQLDASASFAAALADSAMTITKQALDGLAGMPVDTIKTGVFAARDALKSVTGVAIKFKPWGAVKVAGNVAKWAGIAGAAVQVLGEAFDVYKNVADQKELAKLKDELIEMIKEHFKAIYDVLGNEQLTIETFAPQIKVFETVLATQQDSLKAIVDRQEKLAAIRRELAAALRPAPVLDGEWSATGT